MRSLNILLLEDSLLDAELILAHLDEGNLNHQVQRVDTRDGYLRALKASSFQLILSDYSLPAFSGEEALEIAQETCPDVPFIFVSGAIGEEIAIESVKSGATDYVLKQRLERLVPAVRRALREAKERAERHRAEEALRFLAEASSVLGSSLDYQDTLERVARLSVPRLADWCVVDVLEDDGAIHRLASAHVDPSKMPLLKKLQERYPPTQDYTTGVPKILRQGKPRRFSQVSDEKLRSLSQNEEHYQILKALEPGESMVVPLIAQGKILGVITLALRFPSNREYDNSDLDLAEELANRAAAAIDNARLYRELQRADQAKDEFLAMLAHELRNPLAPIVNALHVLRLRGPDYQTLERIQDMLQRQVHHMVRLIDDLLDVSRITRGKILLRPERVDLIPLIGHTVDDSRAEAEKAGLTLTVDLPKGPVWVQGDPTRLSQMIGNLLHNAIKFTDSGGEVAVLVNLYGETVEVQVKDTGIGMEPETVSRIFEPFSQADRSLDRSQGGLGLGLALVNGLAELHGGSVSVYSRGLGKGSEFTLTLPLKKGIALAIEPSQNGRQPEITDSRLKRILVIEDNQDAADSLKELLELSGCEVEVAYTGPTGLDAARRFQPELVICDVGLPGMDGYAVAAELRKDESAHRMQMIAVSGYGQEDDRRRSKEAGFDLHLTKPVAPEDLQKLLEELLPSG